MVREISERYSISLKKAARPQLITRSVLYYKPKGENKENLKLMELIDYKYTEDPTYGSRRMREYLQKLQERGYPSSV